MMDKEEFRLRVRNVGAFVVTVQLDGVILDANDWAVAKLESSDVTVIGKQLLQAGWFASLPASQERVADSIRVAAAGRMIRREIDICGPGGEREPLEFTFTPSVTEAGEVKGILVTGIDASIREQSDAEKNLQFLNELGEATRELANPARIMEVTARMVGQHMAVSRAAYADVENDNDTFTIQHDYTDGCETTVGEYSLELFGPQAVKSMRGGQLLAIRDVSNEVQPGAGLEAFQSIDIAAIICCPLVKFGNLVAMMAVHQTTPRDWTSRELSLMQDVVERSWSSIERSRAQQRLRQKERQFEELFEFAPDAIIMANTEGVITLVNQRAENLFGYARHELIGETVETLVPLGVRDQHVKLRNEHSSLPAHEPFVNSSPDLRGRRKDGSEFSAEVSLSPLETDLGPMIAASIRDTSERVRLEMQLQQAQKMETVGQLAGGVAHDFNNLLTVINASVELLIDRAGQDEGMREDLSTILRAGEQAASLTRQLLALSRQQVLNPSLIDLNEVLQDMEPMLQRLIGETIAVKFRPAREVAAARLDRTQIDQVILNLALNSRDAMPDGGTLILEVSLTELDKALVAGDVSLKPGPHVVLSVSDTGQGMDEGTRRKVFEPFFTTKPAGKGTGLGLATVYGIVQQSGGYISVESQSGKGTTVQVYFPRCETETLSPKPAAVSTSTGDETILVVEDEKEIRQVSRIMLERRGYTVHCAESGQQALEIMAAKGDSIDLILSDVVMPGTSGPETLREIRKLRPDMKVLYVSGYAADLIAKHSLDDDMTHFLSKPFTLAELSRSVREALDS